MALPQVKIPSVTMNNGVSIPVLGYGTWLGLDNKFEFLLQDLPKMMDTLSYAIDIGYRHIDTAHLYRVEPEIGEIVAKKIQDGVCKREDLFITTKVWHHFHCAEDVEVSLRASLKRLKMDYVDQLLIHWPMSINQDGIDEKIDYLETWKGFEEVLKKGLTKTIGVSNFNVQQIQRLVDNCTVKPQALQIELNLTFGQNELVDLCKLHNIVVVAYSAFGCMVSSRSGPDSPPPRPDDPQLAAMAKKYGKTPTQLALRYFYQRGIITIPKTLTKERVLENASIFDFELEAADCEVMAKFDIGHRTVRPVFWQDYENYPFEKIEVGKMEIPVALRKWKNGANQDLE